MNYQETLKFLYQQLPMFQRLGPAAYKADLTNTIEICRILGDPQLKFPSVHIAGTNGKGSVSHILASIFQEAGYRTGLFTSPHLKDFRERIRINGEWVSEAFIVQFVNEHIRSLDHIKPSFFEYTFAMAMHYFACEKVDIAIVETGMGGRLDSSNIVNPILSVITNIGMDHTQFLGDTLEKIAVEKAGIIKPGVPVMIGERQLEIESIFNATALAKKAPIFSAEDIFHITRKKANEPNIVNYAVQSFEKKDFYNLSSPLTGNYQLKNILTAMAATSLLNNTRWHLPRNSIEMGVKNVKSNTGIRGRWEMLSEKPLVICDTAHNLDGIKQVVEQIRNTPHQQLHVVLGVVADKEISEILSLWPKDASYYFCKANIPRGLPAETLKATAQNEGLSGIKYDSVAEAYAAALKASNPDDLVFIGGSTFVVAEVL
ncbi:MAG: bifunctional folylpolyglutamate synthase/dihydrofolate synthase [Bacteroidetes bacterium]|nr:bifunctional folylpolyglutamate synthase/dihydrofolate synthase [Bacteroidota bacterium]